MSQWAHSVGFLLLDQVLDNLIDRRRELICRTLYLARVSVDKNYDRCAVSPGLSIRRTVVTGDLPGVSDKYPSVHDAKSVAGGIGRRVLNLL